MENSQYRKKVTANGLAEKKLAGQKITMLTAYDHPTAKLLDDVGVDVILVGDSLGMVVLGYESTLPVTMQDMLHHCKAVSRGARNSLLVGDMPFLSYQVSIPEAVQNAGRLMAEGGMGAVKLEGGRERLETIKAIVAAGIPVMGHIGLTPQSVHKFGGYKPRGKSATEAARIVEDALLLQEEGCFALVLESIPTEVAELISHRLDIPVIGIGAGLSCDGQVLVIHDALGLTDTYQPKFTKRFVDSSALLRQGVRNYLDDVQNGLFPSENHTVHMNPAEFEEFRKMVG